MADQHGILRTTALLPGLTFNEWLQTGSVVAVVIFALLLTSTQNLLHSLTDNITEPSFHRARNGAEDPRSELHPYKFLFSLVITAVLFYLAYVISKHTAESRTFLSTMESAYAPTAQQKRARFF